MAGVPDLTVGAQVSGERGGRLVLVSAESTAVVWVLQVSLHMFHKYTSLVEGLPADFTTMRLDRISLGLVAPLMSRHVSLQASPLAELLAADTAGVHLLAAVLLHVSL